MAMRKEKTDAEAARLFNAMNQNQGLQRIAAIMARILKGVVYSKVITCLALTLTLTLIVYSKVIAWRNSMHVSSNLENSAMLSAVASAKMQNAAMRQLSAIFKKLTKGEP